MIHQYLLIGTRAKHLVIYASIGNPVNDVNQPRSGLMKHCKVLCGIFERPYGAVPATVKYTDRQRTVKFSHEAGERSAFVLCMRLLRHVIAGHQDMALLILENVPWVETYQAYVAAQSLGWSWGCDKLFQRLNNLAVKYLAVSDVTAAREAFGREHNAWRILCNAIGGAVAVEICYRGRQHGEVAQAMSKSFKTEPQFVEDIMNVSKERVQALIGRNDRCLMH